MPKGPNGQKRAADVTQNAVHVMRIATGEISEPSDKSAKARAGSTSGKIGGVVRASKLSPQERKAAAAKRMAAFLLALLMMGGSALALTVSKKVGPLLLEAQTLAKAKNYKAALAKLNEAEAVESLPGDATVINHLRHNFEVASSGAPPLTPHVTPQFPQL
jgi:hypothetical protein